MITVLVADDQELVRSGFTLMLEVDPDIAVVAEAVDGVDAVEQARTHVPDVILMDIRMPRLDGIEATRRITVDGLPSRILILTTYDADEYLHDAIRAGAAGFLLKDTRRDDLTHAIRTVAAGDALLHPALTRRLLEQFSRTPRLPDQARGLPSSRTGRTTFCDSSPAATPTARSPACCSSRSPPSRHTWRASAASCTCATAPTPSSWPTNEDS